MLVRVGCRRGTYVSARSLHQTSPAADFMSWFQKKKQQTEPKTKDLIKDIESQKGVGLENSRDRTRLKLVPSNFIGEPAVKSKTSQSKKIAQQLDLVAFNKWIHLQNKLPNEQELSYILQDCLSHTQLSKEEQFPNLVTKFIFTKALQQKIGYIIPDYQITILNTPMAYQKYLLAQFSLPNHASIFHRNDAEPRAISIKEDTYKSPNIYVKETVPVKDQKRTFNKIIHDVQVLGSANTKRLIERTKNEPL